MVLEGDQGECEAVVLAEEELERNMEAQALRRRARNKVRGGEAVCAADHGVECVALAGARGELCPDLHPFAGLPVDLLLADFEADLLDECVADRIHVAHRCAVRQRQAWQCDVEIDLAEEIGVAGHDAGDALAEGR